MKEYGAERIKITDGLNVAYKIPFSIEKVKCYIDGHEVYGEQLCRNVENIGSVERYLRNVQKIRFDKLLISSLFSAHIYERDDFENPGKLLRLKDNLEQAGYFANLSLDQELNLYRLSVADKDKRRNEAIIDYEFCRQEDYRRYYRIYDRIAAYHEHEVRVDKEDLLCCSAGQLLNSVNQKWKQRFKGHGEMYPVQLRTTIRDRMCRKLVKAGIEVEIEVTGYLRS